MSFKEPFNECKITIKIIIITKSSEKFIQGLLTLVYDVDNKLHVVIFLRNLMPSEVRNKLVS